VALEINLHTGRHHIRFARSWLLVGFCSYIKGGDLKYGLTGSNPDSEVIFMPRKLVLHPVSKEEMTITSPNS